MSDPKLIMHRSIHQVEQDLERIGAVVRMVEKELDSLSATKHRGLVAQMKERLSEVHTRLEGLSAFVQACERRALHAVEPEDIDLWL